MGFFVRLKTKMDLKEIESLVERDIGSMGCTIWGLELLGNINNQTLRIYIDKNRGISIGDCEKVSKHVSRVLEVNSSLIENFNLEVSSPGIERKFFKKQQYRDYIGSIIKIKYLLKNKFKTVKGILLKVDEDSLLLKKKDEKIKIEFNFIQKANLKFK
tara:strand:+ start:57 stop:530 length:474 start_codon:yes stop_codon:yes gene_type:complete